MLGDGGGARGEGPHSRPHSHSAAMHARCTTPTHDATSAPTATPERSHGDPQAAAVLSGPRWAWRSILVHGQNQAKASGLAELCWPRAIFA